MRCETSRLCLRGYPPLVPRISEAERTNRRERLVAAAWRCLAQRAYSDLTVDDVCAEAAVSKGAFYGYFDSKQELLHELLQRESASLDAVISDLSAAPIGAAEKLRRFARACLKDAEDTARMQVRADLAAAVGGDPALRARSASLLGAGALHCERGSTKASPPTSCARFRPTRSRLSCWPSWTGSRFTTAAIRRPFSGATCDSHSMSSSPASKPPEVQARIVRRDGHARPPRE